MMHRLGVHVASGQTRREGSMFVSAVDGTTPQLIPSRHKTLSRFSGYFVLVVGTAISRILGFVTVVILARELGPSGFGEVAIFLTVVTFWVSGDFIDLTYVRFASAVRHEDERRRYLNAALLLKLAWDLALVISAVPLAWAISHLLLGKPVLLPAILLGIVCGLGLNLLSLRAAIFQAQERFMRFTAITSAFYLLCFALVAAVSLATSEPRPGVYYGAYVASATLVGAVACGSLLRAVRHLRFERDTIGALVRFSRWLFGANLGSLITERLSLFLLAAFAPLASVGEYGAALRVAAIVTLLTGTLAPALLPRAAPARQSPALLRPYLAYAASLSALIALVVAGLWLAAPLLVDTLFGAAYDGAVPLVRLLLVAALGIAVYTPLSQLYFGDSQPRRMLYLAILRLALTVGVGVLLISRFDAEGAAVTTALVEIVALAYVTLSLRNELMPALRHHRASEFVPSGRAVGRRVRGSGDGSVEGITPARSSRCDVAIAMVSNALDPPPDEGVKKSAQELAAALERRGASVYRVAGKLLLSSRMLRGLRSNNVDVVIYLPMQSATVASLVRSKVLRSLGNTKVVLISLQPRALEAVPRRVARWLGPDHLLTPDPGMLQTARDLGLDAAFLQVGVEHDRFAPVGPERKLALRLKYGVPTGAVIALHVGHARWRRGLSWLADLGAGVLPVVAISRSLGVDPAVARWLQQSPIHLIDTYVPEIQELYQLADVYVFPVLHKGAASAAPLSVLEAMACNLPVVSTPFGALPHMLSGRAGLFFVEDQQQFRSAVATAVALPPDEVRTRQQTLRYDWTATADSVVASALTVCRRT